MLAFIRMLIGCLVTAVVIVAVGAGVGYWVYGDVTSPGPLAEARTVIIPPHTGVSGISDLLAEEGVIRHPLTFKLAAELTGRGGALKAGEYEFPAGATAVQVMDVVATGKTVKHRLTIREGLTSAEVVAMVREAPLLTGDPGPVPADGELLPETYIYSRGDTRESLIQRMQDAMAEAVDAAWAARRSDLTLASPQEALIIASIVEKESAKEDERAHIAAVFLNRLRLGMRLQADPTVLYALAQAGTKLDRPLARGDLAINSPYNTYVAKGLPPGPICNPGKAALRAAMRPERSEDLYFVADGSGGHVFARTLAEHNKNVAQYLKGMTPAEAEPVPLNPPPVVVAPPPPPVQHAMRAQHPCRATPTHRCVAR
jgi:UPF0755 protein